MTEISSKQAETFINVFSNLGEAFSKLAKTNIIPSHSLLSQIDNSKFLGKKTLDSEDNSHKSSKKIKSSLIMNKEDSNKIHFSKEKNLKKIKKKFEFEEDSEKSIISSQNLDLEEDNYKKIKNDSISEKNLKKENNSNREIFFKDQKGWSIKIKQNGLIIEMGPFISEKKAKLTISYIKKNQDFLNLIESVNQRKEWLINLSNFIEQLLE
jgi:hypothetical protein